MHRIGQHLPGIGLRLFEPGEMGFLLVGKNALRHVGTGPHHAVVLQKDVAGFPAVGFGKNVSSVTCHSPVYGLQMFIADQVDGFAVVVVQI